MSGGGQPPPPEGVPTLGKSAQGRDKKGAGGEFWMSPYQKCGPVATTLGKGVQGGEAPLWYIICVQISSFRFAIVERS